MKKKFLIGLLSLVSLTACGGSDDNGTGGTPATGGSTITLTPAVLDVPANAGTYTVEVVSGETDWSATTSAQWLTVTALGTQANNGALSLKAEANDGTAERSATVTVKSRTGRATLTVTQARPMQVSERSVILRTAGSTVAIDVTATGDWTATSSDNWLSAVRSGNQLVVAADANTGTSMRQGTVTVSQGSERHTVSVLQDSPEVTDITAPAGYALVWNDEFNSGASELSSDWRHEVQGPGWVNHELQTYVNGQAAGRRVTELVDGKLRITAFKSANTIYSGRVYAKPSTGWTYGYMEARIKLPKGKGTWPAFWMMPVHFTSWPADGEIDIMEEVGYHPNYVSSSLHATDHVHSNGTQVTHEMQCPGAESDYHLYAIKWTPENITTYVDGQVQLSYDNAGRGRTDWPYDDAFYLILNLAWGGDWGGANGVDETALPVTMFVDYVRVFQKQ